MLEGYWGERLGGPGGVSLHEGAVSPTFLSFPFLHIQQDNARQRTTIVRKEHSITGELFNCGLREENWTCI